MQVTGQSILPASGKTSFMKTTYLTIVENVYKSKNSKQSY